MHLLLEAIGKKFNEEETLLDALTNLKSKILAMLSLRVTTKLGRMTHSIKPEDTPKNKRKMRPKGMT